MAKKKKNTKSAAAPKGKRGRKPRAIVVNSQAYANLSAKQKKVLSPVRENGEVVGYAKRKRSAKAKTAAKKGVGKRKVKKNQTARKAKQTKKTNKARGKKSDGARIKKKPAKKAAKKK